MLGFFGVAFWFAITMNLSIEHIYIYLVCAVVDVWDSWQIDHFVVFVQRMVVITTVIRYYYQRIEVQTNNEDCSLWCLHGNSMNAWSMPLAIETKKKFDGRYLPKIEYNRMSRQQIFVRKQNEVIICHILEVLLSLCGVNESLFACTPQQCYGELFFFIFIFLSPCWMWKCTKKTGAQYTKNINTLKMKYLLQFGWGFGGVFVSESSYHPIVFGCSSHCRNNNLGTKFSIAVICARNISSGISHCVRQSAHENRLYPHFIDFLHTFFFFCCCWRARATCDRNDDETIKLYVR